MDYEVKLKIFEGPMDLLLHLIHKNEVDIFDIPIAAITDQYLEYINMMEALNINMAGDFLLMASTLVHIKSKMLLPGLNEGEEEEDPRIEITRPLLEYMRFKEVAKDLLEREILDRDVFTRRVQPDFLTGLKDEDPEIDVSLVQLLDAFKQIVEERMPDVQLTLNLDKWSVKDKTEFIIASLKRKGAIFFYELFDDNLSVSEFVVTFLALLELVHIGLIKVFQPSHDNDIRLIPLFDGNGERDNEYSL